VRSLPKPPVRDDGDHARGKALFASAECGNCHGNGIGDRSVHDVGTGGGYMTPTLAGIGTKKQLMHDGRYATLDDLLTGSKSMGAGSSLSPEDRRALVGYLETL
jgi:mono/diheme cytochrome c family protein